MPVITVQEVQDLIPKLKSKTGERLVRLCAEVFNKRGKTVRLGIGETISPEVQDACQTAEELGEMLRRAVYEMPMPGSFLPRSKCRS